MSIIKAPMPRTTLNIDEPILRDLRKLQKHEKKSLGRLVSDLLASAIHARKSRMPSPKPFQWISKPMKPRTDLADKDALWSVLERDREARSGS